MEKKYTRSDFDKMSFYHNQKTVDKINKLVQSKKIVKKLWEYKETLKAGIGFCESNERKSFIFNVILPYSQQIYNDYLYQEYLTTNNVKRYLGYDYKNNKQLLEV